MGHNRRLAPLALTACLAALLAAPARADFAAVTFNSGGPPPNAGYFGPNTGAVLGFDFTATSDLTVNALGFYDIVTDLPGVPGAADGLAVPHQVGIYRVSDQALIASATVPAGTSTFESDHFRYVGISAVTLTAGTQYVLAATTGAYVNTVFGQDATVNDVLGAGSTNFSAHGITLGDLRQNSAGDGFSLVFPAFTTAPTGSSYTLAGNFGDFAAVPEPSGAALLGLGAAGLAALARRRGRRAEV